MGQTALQTDLETETEINLPPLLAVLVTRLKQEGIYSESETFENNPQWLNDKAIQATHEAIRHASALMKGEISIAEAARHLEKIQVAAAVSERTAYITHTKCAKLCSEVTRHIAHECRAYFHDMKTEHRLLRKH